MKNKDQKLIFLNSYLPRTGHNFASEVIKVFSDHQVLAHFRSETRLSSLIESYYNIYDHKIFFETDKKFFDFLFIDDLRKKLLSRTENKFIMIKDTSLLGADLLPRVFPDDIHLILIRDPKNVFLSLLKGMNLQKKSRKNYIKKFGIFTGFYPYYYSKKLSRQVLSEMPEMNQHMILRYEDLVRKEKKTLLKLSELFGTIKDLNQIKKEIDEIQVINSSFYKEVSAKNIWDMQPKTKKFQPIERKGGNWLIRVAVKLGSKKLRRKLNYI